MIAAFITIRILDIIDILLVSILLYQFYMLIKKTFAINIFIAIFSLYLIWLIVKALNMQLLGTILGQVMGVGVIAIIIVFQQEIRRFLLMLGTRYMSRKFSLGNFFSIQNQDAPKVHYKTILKAVVSMSKSKTGALIVIGRKSALQLFIETGEIINANTSQQLIETIFFKNSPLHDGALIIIEDKIFAARCLLPVSENLEISPSLGTRHRSGLGMSEHNDSFVIIVSEETGNVAYAEYGKLTTHVNIRTLLKKLEAEFA
jgi:diadenylate cyclase